MPDHGFTRAIPALVRVSVMTALQYRSNFLVELLVGAATASLGLVPLLFVFERAEDIAGWTLPESLLVTGFFLMLSGVVGMFVEPNLSAVVDGVRNGQLDYMLIKPVDAQLLASAQRVTPAKIWDLLAGLVVLGWALSQLPTPTVGGVALALGLMVAGLAAMYSLWIAVVCLSFWFVRVDNLRFLLGAITDAGRWPVTVYRGWARLLLTVVVPVALTTSFPALALLGRMDGALLAQALAVAAVGLILSRLLWKNAVGHYTSASS